MAETGKGASSSSKAKLAKGLEVVAGQDPDQAKPGEVGALSDDDKAELERLYNAEDPLETDEEVISPTTGDVIDKMGVKAEKVGTDPYTYRLESLQVDVFNVLFAMIRKHGAFDLMSDQAKSAIRYELMDAAADVINGSLKVHAGQGSPTVEAVCGDVKRNGAKGIMEAKLTVAGNHALRHMLMDSSGQPVFIVLRNALGLTGAGEADVDGVRQERLI